MATLVRTGFRLGLAIKTLLVLVVVAYAATIPITSNSFSAQNGTHHQVTNYLSAIDKGLFKAASPLSATGTCPTGNVTFSSAAKVANNAIVSGDYVYDVQVNTTDSTPHLSCFTVTITITLTGGSQQTVNVKIATDNSPQSGWTIDCKFDLGATLPSSPYSFKFSVQ